MKRLTQWNILGYKDFSNHYFDFFKNANHKTKSDSKIYFRITEPTWSRRGELVSVVMPRYNNSSYTFFDRVFCMVRKNLLKDTSNPWFTFYEEDLEVAMFKTDLITSEYGYIISDVFSVPILKGSEICVVS